MLSRTELLTRYRLPDRATPRVRVNFISSIDGAATLGGVSGGLNNPDDKLVFDTLRLLCDVILVGAGTVRAEGYGGIRVPEEDAAWRVRHGLAPQPTVAVVSARLELPPAHPVFRDPAARPIVVTHRAAPPDRRKALAAVADVLVCGAEAIDVGRLPVALAERGFPQILCEGGPSLLGSLLAADRVDEFCLTLSPVLEGGVAGRVAAGVVQTARRMALLHSFASGDMLFLRYARPAHEPGEDRPLG
jgi:riboflavin biosynthesis pyrimidine reductase